MNLTEYMSGAIEKLVGEALKASMKNPRESAFILKYMLAQKKAAKKRDAMEKQGKHIPPFLIASIASQCNLFCKGCYARANHQCTENACQDELNCAQWEKIFREAKGLGISFILLAGGEPFLRRDIIEAASGFPEIVFPVFTNGTMMNEPYLDLFDRSRNLVPVLSIEGGRAETDARRGDGTYAALIQAMEKMKQNGIFYGVSVTVTTQNIGIVTGGEFIDMLYQNGCKLAFYVEYVPVAASTESLAPTDTERVLLAERQEKLRKQYENMIFLSFPGDEKKTGGCLAAGRGFFHINAAGGAEPCPFSPYSDMNLKECSLLEALQSPLFSGLNVTGLLNDEHNGGCVLFGKQDEVKGLLSKP